MLSAVQGNCYLSCLVNNFSSFTFQELSLFLSRPIRTHHSFCSLSARVFSRFFSLIRLSHYVLNSKSLSNLESKARIAEIFFSLIYLHYVQNYWKCSRINQGYVCLSVSQPTSQTIASTLLLMIDRCAQASGETEAHVSGGIRRHLHVTLW